MTRIFDGYCKLLDMLIALALAIMVVLVFGNVVLRYAFNSGITVSEEVSRWLFVWVTFLGAAVAVKERGHLGTDFLVARLPVLGKKICLVVGHLLMLYATWLLFSGSLAQAKINWDVEAPVTGASVAIFYASGIVFAVSAAVFLLSDLVRALTGRLGEEELVMVQESEDLAQLGRDDGNPHGKR
ncbi:MULTISPECIES: TRAP transporter small permease [Variovorax]|jgi:TRAP-type C4-dicarboxylate transport system permease small subunit|uniref:TRAP transporter small permease protein n=2 Tax=Variovorax paradoxus TaxID=34073 RepID=A0AAW8E990_VARPD|nr:TRAP transporter small permease [Variovorax paradoxus]MBW8716689.1 TRAP transporter small permease [Variovorax paradoxus]MDP9969413.1 TRAP-type C4-dicarboxylate transport system permease small subunit [Variovorax paradoxus]